MKVTTASWFDFETQKAGRRVVSISGSEPRYLTFGLKIFEFVPERGLVRAIKAGNITEKEYTANYLDKMLPLIDKGIARLQDGDVLCCWEDEGKFCHRRILAEELKKRGIEVEVK